MRTVAKDLWSLYDKGGVFAVIPTNLQHHHGVAVMGKGLALQAKERFPALPARYGARLAEFDGAEPHWWPFLLPDLRLILFPTKNYWQDPADLPFIEQGLQTFVGQWINYCETLGKTLDTGPFVAFPKLGCGCGGLDWDEVQPVMAAYLTCERFAVCVKGNESAS